ncbi:unnamed protein product [Peronospora belbahrii]|uniref:HAT C-terminal dimerisation domain-containing protein n=1 Tax=Peronospora belbahrii TaxID=622444 RepID=A0ABN8D991_9STRA|nr:unnamed protein product [Peronospora belbahrii]
MDTIPANEVPEWYIAEINRRQQLFSRSKTVSMATISGYQTHVLTSTDSDFTKFGESTQMKSHFGDHNIAINKPMISKNIATMEEKVAMHFFTTMSMENLIQGKTITMACPFLLETLQMSSPEFVWPKKEKIMTQLLDQCVNKVQERVDGYLKSGVVPVTLSFEAITIRSEINDVIVRYMVHLASLEKYPMYLESVKVPSSREHQGADVEWSVRDVGRMVKKLSCPVAGCVMPCSVTGSQRIRNLLEERFPAMYFHGCLRDALWSIVRDIFTASNTTDREHSIVAPFVQDLQQFALQCKDLAIFLLNQENKAHFGEAIAISSEVIHVSVRQRLTVKEAFLAILQAEPFLDVDNVLNQLFPAALNGNTSAESSHRTNIAHLQTQLVKILRSPQFGENLRKFLEMLRPVYRLLELLGDDTDTTSLQLSEVHSSFSRLAQQFASSPLLDPEEKVVLQQLVRHHQENTLGLAHHLANLLDPVLLGENLPVDTMANVEQKLMSSLHVDGTSFTDAENEALYAQYTDFKKFALNQKTNKAQTLVFRTLKEREKSPLQFWLDDGTKWPLLQAIACRIFVMPVCTASSRIVSEADVALQLFREKADFLTSDKLAYVRINTQTLSMAEEVGSSLVTVAQKLHRESIANDITASMVV